MKTMVGKKAWLGKVWGNSGLATASLKAGVGASRNLLILAYHRILDIPDEDAFPGDPELISASTEDFERQMRFVRDHFTPLKFADLLEAMDRGTPLPRRSLIVTFDDGHFDNYTHAFPILKSTGVPATIFLATQNIDSPEASFWFDRVSQLLYFAPRGVFEIEQLNHRGNLGTVSSRRSETEAVLRKLKRQPNEVRVAALRELDQNFARHVPDNVAAQRAAMTWSEIREMSDAGIEFGSHTVTHPILSKLGDEAILQELADSRAAIRSHIAQPIDTIAYPVGKIDAFDDRVTRTAKACGYRIGVSYESGNNRINSFDRYAMRRLAVERYVSFAYFKSMLSLPRVFN